MKIVIVGGGLIGLCAAYFLRVEGHEVTVVERQEGPGRETSFANGALLTPGMAEPWNAPGCWRVLLQSLGRSDAPLQLRWRALPSLGGWGIGFLRNSEPARFERNARSNLHLGMHSLRMMDQLRRQAGIEYGRTARGSLKVFRDEASLERTYRTLLVRPADGLRLRRLSGPETIAMEPALAPVADQLAGAIHYETDETGDAYRFCCEMAKLAQDAGVELRFGSEIRSLVAHGDRIIALATQQERVTADRYLIAAGSYTTPLLKHIGIKLPVRPAKGYSLTIDDPESPVHLAIPVIDDDLHAVVVPLGKALRVAGTAEFAGYDLALTQARIENLVAFVRRILPQTRFDPARARPWCGLRAAAIDGVPIIGPTRLENLFVSTGHGHLGWTMAAGSGHLLACILSGKQPPIDPAPYSMARFGRLG